MVTTPSATTIGDRQGAGQVPDTETSAVRVDWSTVLAREMTISSPLKLKTAFAVTGSPSAAHTVDSPISVHANTVRFILRPPTT